MIGSAAADETKDILDKDFYMEGKDAIAENEVRLCRLRLGERWPRGAPEATI